VSNLRDDFSRLVSLATSSLRRWAERRGVSVRSAGSWLAAAVVLAVLPFVVLIRGGVLIYQSWGLGTWPSLVLAAFATVSLLAAYAWSASRRLGAGRALRVLFARGAMGVGVAYVIYALVFVAGANVKSADVQAEYRSLHPLLRVASSAVILVDSESVITDASRYLGDYERMGLSPNEASLHFTQDDGYVHALDLRTVGRSRLRNVTLRLTFRALGFLRHGGTGDHLHVSLALS
jgi:hypothetical protein